MLEQILRDMWIEPELLGELDESQKQTLFCRMREEQVRRWRQWNAPSPPQIPRRNRPGKKKKVGFLLGADGEPWVWVMGEHRNDKTIEEILEEEARESARKLAEREIRITVEAELDKFIEQSQKNIEEMEIGQSLEVEDIYCSADELKATLSPNNPSSVKRDALQEISLNKQHNVLQSVALWEERMMEEKTSEIFNRIQKKKQEAVKEAEEAEPKVEKLWREQQRKAKEADLQKREIARRAREEHRKSLQDLEQLQLNQSPTVNPLIRMDQTFGSSKPPNKDAVVEWFRSSQIIRRAGLEPNSDHIAPWFHGLISRHEAEALLSDQPVGSFLVRLSERIWGYAISYKDTDRCKHYLVDASNGHYQFLGTNQIPHKTLGELVEYHGVKPITSVGGELLGRPCHRTEPLPPHFETLFIRAR